MEKPAFTRPQGEPAPGPVPSFPIAGGQSAGARAPPLNPAAMDGESDGANLPAPRSPGGSLALGAGAAGALALGAVALGLVAIGALAIGALAIGALAIGRARIKRLEIDELIIRSRGPEEVDAD